MKSKNQIQPQMLLEVVRDHSGIVTVHRLFWGKLMDKFLPDTQDIHVVTLSPNHRFLETPAEEIDLCGLSTMYLQYLDPRYRGSSVARAFWTFSDPTAAEGISVLLQVHFREFGGCSVNEWDIDERLERLAVTHERAAERHVQPKRMFQILPGHSIAGITGADRPTGAQFRGPCPCAFRLVF